jgi:hypothetical protein
MIAVTAINIPKIPYHTARFAFSWLDKPPKESINKIDAAIYAADNMPVPIKPTF